jgi:hypothetical protein
MNRAMPREATLLLHLTLLFTELLLKVNKTFWRLLSLENGRDE